MMKRLIGAVLALTLCAAQTAWAGGPFGSIHIGNWKGGAYSDNTGNFSYCIAGATYKSGVYLAVGLQAAGTSMMLLNHQLWHFTPGEAVAIDVTFDGQRQFHLFGVAKSITAVVVTLLPPAAAEFRKAGFMAAVIKGSVSQFNLEGMPAVMQALNSCVATVKTHGLNAAGDFSAKVVSAPVAQPPASTPPSGQPPANAGRQVQKTGAVSGTGFVITADGYIVTNNHVVANCVGDIHGKVVGEAPSTLRLVSNDAANDLALLKSTGSFPNFTKIRGTAIAPGEPVTAIGYPYNGLLSSDFTVTTGIISSLGGIRNDSRYLQISVAVQPGNSGGPLLDSSGNVVGVVSAKLDAVKMVAATGTIPENINFAIKTGVLRDFLDKNVVAYQTATPGTDIKTSEIASNARAYTLLISCNVAAQEKK